MNNTADIEANGISRSRVERGGFFAVIGEDLLLLHSNVHFLHNVLSLRLL